MLCTMTLSTVYGVDMSGLFHEVDMTVAPPSIQEIREKVMDFTMPFFFNISVILMKKPDPRETQWKRLIKQLRWEVMVLADASFRLYQSYYSAWRE